MTRRDTGVTLVELVVVMAVAGLVVPAVVGALVVGWRTTDATAGALADNRNRSLTHSLLTRDVQGAGSVDRNSADTACTVPGDTLVVRFRWTETDASGTARARASAWVLVAGSDPTLQRRYCADATTVGSSVAAAHGVTGTPSADCRTTSGALTACSSAARVDLVVTDASGSFTATGTRRAS